MFRFTIRDVLWAMLAVALALGWTVSFFQWHPKYVESIRFGAQGYREADRLEAEVKMLKARVAELESAPEPMTEN